MSQKWTTVGEFILDKYLAEAFKKERILTSKLIMTNSIKKSRQTASLPFKVVPAESLSRRSLNLAEEEA